MRDLYVLLMMGVLVATSSDVKNRLKSSIGQPGHQESNRTRNNTSLQNLTVSMIVPYTNFGAREYSRAINKVVQNLYKGHTRTNNKGQTKFSFLDKYRLQVSHRMMKLTPSPTGKYFHSRLNLEKKGFILLLDVQCV